MLDTHEPLGEVENFVLHRSPLKAALPDELPAIPDLSHLPQRVLHTATVETLIGQSDDLYARLKVTLRRSSLLEGQMLELERQNEDLLIANTALETQIQTRSEKESLLREKTLRAETLTSQLTSQVEKFKLEVSLLRGENLSLPLLRRYKRRVEKWVRRQIETLKMELSKSRQAELAKEARISDLRALVIERDEEIATLHRDFASDQAKLVEQYESAQKVLAGDIEKLLAEQKLLRGRAALVDQAAKNEALAQNRLISLERQEQELTSERDRARKELKATTAMMKSDQAEIVRLKIELARLTEKLTETAPLGDQAVESQSSPSAST